ncbi:histidine kinase [Leptolyngbya valderiana BDU 20041]|nr:histidine kinase [Leptolyngbya valderiana BDU 20041]PPT07224.1 Circadian input kinase A [Geitlerinema sp. FC II]
MAAPLLSSIESSSLIRSDSFKSNLSLDSTLAELSLHDCQIDVSRPGRDVVKLFDLDSLLPGVILVDRGHLVGVVSRRRFLEHMSRPYGVELFSRRPIASLYSFAHTEVLCCQRETLIVMAARRSLQRPPELLYEPILVEIEPNEYRLLDVHQLLVAQSEIHQLTTQLLNEQTKAQMMQTEKMSSLGRMVAGVAHEIRNPVNCINGNVGFLINYFEDLMELTNAYERSSDIENEEIETLKADLEFDFLKQDLPKILDTMKVSADRLTQIVSSLYSFSHVGHGSRKLANLHDCLDSTLLILSNRLKKGVEVVKQYGDLPLVKCYSGQLSQVFMNLVGNAIDALESLENSTETPRITLTTEVADDERAIVRITDNGPGIPEAIQQRIFDNFFTTKPPGKGTGLGLAIAYQIITENHGGELKLSSKFGDGATFEIRLPLH